MAVEPADLIENKYSNLQLTIGQNLALIPKGGKLQTMGKSAVLGSLGAEA